MVPRYPASTPFLYSSFIQSFLYGTYIATLASCIRWLAYEDEGWTLRKKVKWQILTVTLLVWTCLTAYLSIYFQVTLDVMFDRPHNQLIMCLLPMIEDIAIIIADAVLMYRCWVVYARSWRAIVLPIVLWLSCFVALCLLAKSLFGSKTSPRATWSIFPTVFISCHIANNIYGTSAIVYEIMRVAKTRTCTSRRLKKTSRILIESGLFYTVSGALNLVFQANGDKYPYTAYMVDIFNFSMTGITFNLIIIRTGEERANPRNDFMDSQFVAGELRALSASNHRIPGTNGGSSQL